MAMEVILIRHGRTAANQKHVYQRGAETLSSSGQKEIADVADALQAYAPTHLLCSPMNRAQDTATILGEKLQLNPTTFREVREIRWPSYLEGRARYSFTSVRYMVRWFLQREVHTDDAKAGESYDTLRKRIERAKNIFESYPPDARIVVVSHSVFINFFVEHACSPKPLSLRSAVPRLFKILTLRNTNAVRLQCDNDTKHRACSWQVIAFNKSVSELT